MKHTLNAEQADALRPACGQTRQLWLHSTWASTAFANDDGSFTIEAGNGEIPNLLTLQEVTVVCPIADPNASPPPTP